MSTTLDHFSWNEWASMGEAQRQRIVSELNPSCPGGDDLLDHIDQRFKQQYGNVAGVNKIDGIGNYHGLLIIGVQVQWPFDPEFPESFYGLRVMKFYTWASRQLIEKLGDAYNEYGDILDLHYEEIVRELRSEGHNIETAPKDEIVEMILRHKDQRT
jgi:hypothetical protein